MPGRRAAESAGSERPRVEILRLQPVRKQAMQAVDSLELVRGQGIRGDCHWIETPAGNGGTRDGRNTANGNGAASSDANKNRANERQVSLLSAQAEQQLDELGRPGLCMKRFAVNIVVSGWDGTHPEHALGHVLKLGGAELRITQLGKPCFAEDCAYAQTGRLCPLDGCMYAAVEQSGIVRIGDAVL